MNQPNALHQQQGGMSLEDFAKVCGKSASWLQRLAQRGRIVGARKHAISKKWWVYPPAQIIEGRHW